MVRGGFLDRKITIWLLALGLVLFGYFETKQYTAWLISANRQQMGEDMSFFQNALEMIMHRRLDLAVGLEKFVVSRSDTEIIRDFPLFASGLQNEFEGVRNVGVAKGGVLSLIYPIKGNEGAINYNLMADETPSVKSDIAKAIASKELVVSTPFELRQGGLGVAARKAIFKNNNLWGFISVVIDVPTAINYSGLDKVSQKTMWALRDENKVVFAGDKMVFAKDPALLRIRFGDNYWEMGSLPSGGWVSSILGKVRLFEFAWIILIMIVLMLVNYLWVFVQKSSGKIIQWGGVWETAKPAFWYLFLGVIWILFSDSILSYLVADPALFAKISIVKGWVFVIVTALLLFLWTSRSFDKLETLLSLLKKTQRVAKLGYYVLDIRSGYWEGSDVLLEMMGIDNSYKTDVEGWLNLVHPDQRQMMKNYFIHEVLEAKKPFDKEYKILNRMTGEELWVHGMGKLDFDFQGEPIRMIGTIQNISERRKVQEELASLYSLNLTEKQKMESILRDIGDAVFVTDSKKRIVLANIAMEKLFGLPEKEMTGKKIKEVIKLSYESSGKEPEDLIDAVFNKKKLTRPTETLILKNKYGTKISVDGVASPVMDQNEKLVGTVWILRDVTKQRELEKMRTDFISLASHQMRTPLTGIKWFVELLKGEVTKTTGKSIVKYVNSIGESNQRLIDLVNDLLVVSKNDEGFLSVKDLNVYSIKDICQEALVLQGRLFAEKNIQVEGMDQIPEKYEIETDKIQMIQVLGNLLNNAGRYSATGSKIDIRVEKKGGNYIFSVKDRGLGIPESQKPRVFQKFFRADNVAKNIPGSGLGLYLAKSIIEGYRGKIWFESKEGKGTTFFVKLPIKQKKDG